MSKVSTRKPAAITLRVLLATVLVLSSLLISTPATADETRRTEAVGSDTVAPDVPKSTTGQDEPVEELTFTPQSFDPQATYTGTCGANGNNLTWSLDTATGTLTISGTGAMANYSGYSAPWYDYWNSIFRITISNGVTSIGNYAFFGCKSLTSFTIPSSVASIGNYAFYFCSSLTSITIPSGVASIGSYAFYNCTSLKSVTISSGVTSIGSYAFEYCRSLVSVAIPSSVTSIGSSAFSNCTSLTSITIPSSVTSIGNNAFLSCTSLTSATIRSGVTSIGYAAFSNCTSLTSVTIPSSVTSIGNNAFLSCSSLTAISVASDNTAYSSDSYGVLFNKAKTELIQFPPKCSQKTYVVPSSVTSIGNQAFYNCTSLTSVTIPSSVTSIGYNAFAGCKGPLYCAVSSRPSGWSSSWDSGYTGQVVWGNSGQAYTATFNPNGGSVSPTSVTRNYDEAVGTLPAPTRTGYTFAGWYTAATGGTQITSTTKVMADVTYWAHWTVNSYTVTFNPNGGSVSPTSVIRNYDEAVGTLPTPTRVGYTFDGWFTAATGGAQIASTTKVTANVTYYAHWTANSYTVTLNPNGGSVSPASVTKPYNTEVGTLPTPTCVGYTFDGWFTAATGGTKIASTTKVTDNVTYYAHWTLVAYTGSCGTSSSNLTWSLDIATGVLTISGTGTMASWSNGSAVPWASNRSLISRVVVSNGVTSIGNYAFQGCEKLVSVSIPASVTTIGSGVFLDCPSLVSISVDSGNTAYSSDSYGVLFDKVKTKLVQFPPECSQKSYTIPSSVTSIGDSAFYGCSALASVIIPANVTLIGNEAFRDCSALTSMTIPLDKAKLGNGVFYGCTSLKSVTIPEGATAIGEELFANCTSLTSITLPSTITSIGKGAFQNCTGLTTITIPSKVTAIGAQAFSGCTSIKSVTIPSGVSVVNDFAFYGCTSLATLTLSTNTTSIGTSAFAKCTSLTSVTLPSKVSTIGQAAFANCTKLVSVNIPASVETIGASVFQSCTSLASVNIPLSVTSIGSSAFYGCKGPLYCAASSKPSGWSSEWTSGYTSQSGQVVWGRSEAAASYDITLNANSGTVSPAVVVRAYNTETGTLPVPTRTGYTFDGWYTATSGGTKIATTTKVTAHVTYYAHWTTDTTPAPSVPITQHAGANRFETAAKASQTAYPDPTKVDAVIVSFAENFPDALAASYLAGVADAPILLTSTATLHQATLAEINRLKPQTIYITGSTTVIGSGVEQTLKALSFKPTVIRLAGAIRTQTAVAIANEAKRMGGTPQTAFVVYASNYPDALSVGSLSASRHVPILLTDKDTLSPETQKYLIDNNIKDIIVIGGPPAVSEKVVTQLKGLSTKPTVSRWSGSDRYLTAKDVITKATAKWSIKPTSVGIALGDNFPDALVGGAAMGNRGGILVISPPKTLSDAARTVISANKTTIQGVEIFGGTNVIDVRGAVSGLLT